MADINADRPTTDDGREYHLQTRKRDIAASCLLVGSPERAEFIATTLFDSGARLVGDHRGLKSYTGAVNGMPISVVTTGMGSASVAITLPEAVRCGGRTFIRVGSCGVLWPKANVGDSAICTVAMRWDGAGDNWAPSHLPATANHRVLAACVAAADELGLPYHVGKGATTTCFNEGQAREDACGWIPPWIRERHEQFMKDGGLFYSMEEATIFVWCATHDFEGKHLMAHARDWAELPEMPHPIAGAVDAIYANRCTKQWGVKGDEAAAMIAILALRMLSAHGICGQ